MHATCWSRRLCKSLCLMDGELLTESGYRGWGFAGFPSNKPRVCVVFRPNFSYKPSQFHSNQLKGGVPAIAFKIKSANNVSQPSYHRTAK